jgi:Ctr copper transporter family
MRTTLLFRNYIITEPYQFVLTWFLVMFSVVVYYLLRQLLATMDQSMISALGACHGGDKHESSSDMTSMYSTKNLIMKPLKRPVGWRSLKLIHSTIAGVNYGLSLMLMLVAMTFIPSLFLALFIGSVIGEYISCDHHIDLAMGAMRPLSPYVGFVEKMIRFVLCVRNSEKQIDKVEVEDMEEEGKMEVAEEKKRSYELPLIARTVLWLLPRTFSLILMIVTLVWIYRNQNGFGFEPISVFGWHAISMVLFAAVFSNEGMLSYAVPLLPQLMNEPKLSR